MLSDPRRITGYALVGTGVLRTYGIYGQLADSVVRTKYGYAAITSDGTAVQVPRHVYGEIASVHRTQDGDHFAGVHRFRAEFEWRYRRLYWKSR